MALKVLEGGVEGGVLVESRVFKPFGRLLGSPGTSVRRGVSIVLIGGVSLAKRGVNAEVA